MCHLFNFFNRKILTKNSKFVKQIISKKSIDIVSEAVYHDTDKVSEKGEIKNESF